MKHEARMKEVGQGLNHAEGPPGHRGLCCGWEGPTNDEEDDWDEAEMAYWNRVSTSTHGSDESGQREKAEAKDSKGGGARRQRQETSTQTYEEPGDQTSSHGFLPPAESTSRGRAPSREHRPTPSIETSS